MTESSDILGSLMEQLGGGGIDQIGRSLGLTGADVTKVLAGALPAMMMGLTRNASTSGGVEGLLGALDRDHDGSILDDVAGFLSGDGDAAAGAGILGHLFAGRQGGVEQAVSRSSGVDLASVAKVMAMAAPLVMGALGRAKRRQGLDASGLAAALGQQERSARDASSSSVDAFARMLDSDGDGDSMDDLVSLGSQLLGGLFKG